MELVFNFVIGFSILSCGALTFMLARHLNIMKSSGEEIAPLPHAERYRPMLRLLAEDDFHFLEKGGWPADRIRAAKAERRRLFRGYLRSLVKDDSRLLNGLKLRIVQSESDRPDLAHAIARNRMMFLLCLARIEFGLALNTVGLSNVDVSGLVQVVETLRGESANLLASRSVVA